MAYADVIFHHTAKPPKETITQEQIEAAPDLKKDIEDDIENDREPIKYDKEQMETIRQQISKSSHIVGIRPVSIQQIEEEATSLVQSGAIDKKFDRKKTFSVATKNVIMRYFRDKLKNE